MSNNKNKRSANAQRTAPATHWRAPEAEVQAFIGSSIGVSPSTTGPDAREVFAVVNHDGLQALYHWKDDAVAHAKVCAGTVQTMRVNYELPGWVKVMVDRAEDLAAIQSGKHTVH